MSEFLFIFLFILQNPVTVSLIADMLLLVSFMSFSTFVADCYLLTSSLDQSKVQIEL